MSNIVACSSPLNLKEKLVLKRFIKMHYVIQAKTVFFDFRWKIEFAAKMGGIGGLRS